MIQQQLSIALLQYSISQKNHLSTLKRVLKLAHQLIHKKLDFIVLPEMWLGGPSTIHDRLSWVQVYQNGLKELRNWSKKHPIGFFLSQLQEKRKHYFNTAFCIDHVGKIKAQYSKNYLFRFEGEHKIYTPGTRTTLIRDGAFKIGLIVCYDLRFPELARSLVSQGMNVLIVCAQWPKSRMDHWRSLLKARAIENQSFVIGVNRLGSKGGRKGRLHYNGHSMVFDPWGKCLLEMSSSQKIGLIQLDLKKLNSIRRQYPFLKDMKNH